MAWPFTDPFPANRFLPPHSGRAILTNQKKPSTSPPVWRRCSTARKPPVADTTATEQGGDEASADSNRNKSCRAIAEELFYRQQEAYLARVLNPPPDWSATEQEDFPKRVREASIELLAATFPPPLYAPAILIEAYNSRSPLAALAMIKREDLGGLVARLLLIPLLL